MAVARRPDPIDGDVFSYWWKLWNEKWSPKNPRSEQFRNEFYRSLLGRLGTEAFERAARRAWNADGYFPTVAGIVALSGR